MMRCWICGNEIDGLKSVTHTMVYGNDRVDSHDICRPCAELVNEQVEMIKTATCNTPKEACCE